LSPVMGLKETCLRLNGVVDMIQRLGGLDISEKRTFIVGEIDRRIKDVLGEKPSRRLDSSDSEEEE